MGARRGAKGSGRRMHRRMLGVGTVVSAGTVVLPVLLSLLWVPVRRLLPNVDVALVLVLAVTGCGFTGKRSSVLLGALAAAGGFTFFDTQPYERLVMSRQPDVETLVVLVVVSVITGELALRVRRQRARRLVVEKDLARVRQVAMLVSSGEELVTIIAAVADELARLLDAAGCTYEAGGSPVAAGVVVGRDAQMSRKDGQGHLRPFPSTSTRRPVQTAQIDVLEVPVTGMGHVMAQFVVSRPLPELLVRDRLLAAVTLADQVGAALIAQAPETGMTPPTDVVIPLRPTLRVVD